MRTPDELQRAIRQWRAALNGAQAVARHTEAAVNQAHAERREADLRVAQQRAENCWRVLDCLNWVVGEQGTVMAEQLKDFEKFDLIEKAGREARLHR